MAGGKGSTFDNDLLKLIFNATAIANIADNAASSPLTSLYVSLHTATPSGGTQSTSEAAYGSYARVAVTRNSGGWTVTSNSVSPAANITFAAATNAGTTAGAGTETETYFGVGVSTSGANKLLYYGPLSPTILVAQGVTPQISSSTTVTES